MQREQLERALAEAPGRGTELQGQMGQLGRETDQCSHQLAHLHEVRDKALVDMARLEEVAPLVRNERGVNVRTVSYHPGFWQLSGTAIRECCYAWQCVVRGNAPA